mgnify:CR=1 FL=1
MENINKILKDMEDNISYKHWFNIEQNLDQLKKYLIKKKLIENKLINEKKNFTQKYVTDLYWEYDRMSSSGQFTLDSLAKLYGVATDKEMEERLSKMSKEEIKKELEKW